LHPGYNPLNADPCLGADSAKRFAETIYQTEKAR
jgi:hypothetical protein